MGVILRAFSSSSERWSETTMRILIAEDNPELGPDVKRGLERSLYVVDLVTDGEDALTLGLTTSYDLIILDILLPSKSGLEVCRNLRSHKRMMPILFLTALSDVNKRVEGLDMGADDYLVKPFDFGELQARVRALLRRRETEKSAVLSFSDLTLDTRTHEARRGERSIILSSKEYVLLEYLMHHPRQILSRAMITQHVWGSDPDELSNVVEVYMRYLRTKLCAIGEPNLIQTVWGSGYQLKEPEV